MPLDGASAERGTRQGRGRDADVGPATPAAKGAGAAASSTVPGLSDSVTWFIAAVAFGCYTVISVFRYLRRDPASWDLGIFTEYVKQYADLKAPVVDIRAAGFNLLGDHFHPIVAMIAPFFRLFPTPITLLVAQAFLVAVSVLPLSQLARELLGNGAGRAVAAAYAFSWGLQQMVDYDFHELAFAVPLLAFSLSALVRGRYRTAVLWAMPLVFVKEDQGFTLAAIGLIMMVAYRRRGLGLFLVGWGLAWSLVAILVIIPHFNPQHVYPYVSELSPVGSHFSLGGLWTNLAAGGSVKLRTLVLILLPTGFIALRSPIVLAAVPSLALRFVGTNSAYWGTGWHYNAPLMPIVFIAAVDAIARFLAKRGKAVEPGRQGLAIERFAAAGMLAICIVLVFQFPLASLWESSTYTLGPHVAAENKAMALVPDGASVATDLDLLAPLAARTDTFWLGNYGTNPPTQYVVFDADSTDWSSPPTNVLAFVESLIHHTTYRQIFADDGVYVFRSVRPVRR